MPKGNQALAALPCAGAYLLAIGVPLGHALRGPWILMPPAFVFGIIPAADLILARLSRIRLNDALPDSVAFRMVLWLWVPIQLALVYWGLLQTADHASVLERIAFAVSVGVCTGAVGMTFGHELLHGRRFDRALAEILLTSVSYPQLCVEHLTGHHRNFGKPTDYATARFGEGYYHATLRCIRGSWRTTWESEKTRLRRYRRNASDPGNRTFRFALTILATYASIAYWFGLPGVVFFAIQSGVAIAILHAVNYIEHYGLVRRELAAGVYEPPGPHLSWDAPGPLGDVLGLRVQRHADHHQSMSRPYQRLLTHADAPQMPWSYGFMLVLATVPPLWRAVMDPRVVAWNRRRVS